METIIGLLIFTVIGICGAIGDEENRAMYVIGLGFIGIIALIAIIVNGINYLQMIW